ncbi:alpha/beta fold hydrolase [Lachnospiraceae bacterium 29-84]
MIPQYDKKVLLVHGDKDGVAPISYSERAAQLYPSVKFEILSEAGHGFYENDVEKTVDFIRGYLEELFGGVKIQRCAESGLSIKGKFKWQ